VCAARAQKLAYLLRVGGRVARACGVSAPPALALPARPVSTLEAEEADSGGEDPDMQRENTDRLDAPALEARGHGLDQHWQDGLDRQDGCPEALAHFAGDRAKRHRMAQDLLLLCAHEEAGLDQDVAEDAAEGETSPAELDEAALDKASPPLPQSAFAAPRPRAAVPAACCRASCVLRCPQHQGLLPFLHAYTHAPALAHRVSRRGAQGR